MIADILIVDDESDIRSLLSGILEDEGFQVRNAWDTESVLKEMNNRRPTLVLLDVWLEGSSMGGLELLRMIQTNHAKVPVIMISGHANIDNAVQATRDGALDFIEKPFETERLLTTIKRTLETEKLRKQNQELLGKLGGEPEMVGNSNAANILRSAISKVAPTGSRVMIQGPSGSGKEVTARMIHEQSSRNSGPFVVLYAPMLLPERVEEELFGVEDENGRILKVGLLEQAHGGTFFMDEIAGMPMETQGRLVRVLLDQTFTRKNGKIPVKVDVRVISATSANLELEIKTGNFREDLFYRLSVVPIKVPALKDRRSDINQLVEFFMNKASKVIGRAPRAISHEAFAVLQTADWPGNIRQLRNFTEQLLIMSPGIADEEITSEMLPTEITENNNISNKLGVIKGELMSLNLKQAREKFEKEYLLTQMSRFGNNVTKTANFIGMERSALHRKLKSLGIDQKEFEQDMVDSS